MCARNTSLFLPPPKRCPTCSVSNSTMAKLGVKRAGESGEVLVEPVMCSMRRSSSESPLLDSDDDDDMSERSDEAESRGWCNDMMPGGVEPDHESVAGDDGERGGVRTLPLAVNALCVASRCVLVASTVVFDAVGFDRRCARDASAVCRIAIDEVTLDLRRELPGVGRR